MHEIAQAFGIDWRLIAIQIFNFAALATILWYFLYTPILRIIEEREQKIKKGLQDAEDAAQSKLHADTEKKQILTEAQSEASAIVSRASSYAEIKGAEIVTNAEKRAEDLIVETEKRTLEMREQARKESESEIAKLAILAAEKVLMDSSK